MRLKNVLQNSHYTLKGRKYYMNFVLPSIFDSSKFKEKLLKFYCY